MTSTIVKVAIQQVVTAQYKSLQPVKPFVTTVTSHH
jgi:hypothetical protein